MDEYDDEEEDDESSDGEGGVWDELDCRPADDVLRDIIRWFHELVETPGRGDLSCVEWDPDVVRPLYRKHGWPGPQFDGDAFLVGLARTNAYEKAERKVTHFGDKVVRMKARLSKNGRDGPGYLQMKGVEEAAKTVEEVWIARWHLWNWELGVRRDLETLQRAEKERDAARKRGLVLGEVEILAQKLQDEKDSLEKLQYSFRDTEDRGHEKTRDVQLKLRHAEEQVEILQKAYEASRADTEAIFPGKLGIPSPMDHKISGYKGWLQLVTRYVEDSRREIEDIHGWIAQLPEEAGQARTLAHYAIREKKGFIATWLQQCRCLKEALEKCRTGGETDIQE